MPSVDYSIDEAWVRLKRHYSWPQHAAMADLVSSLADSKYAQGIYLWNDHWDCCIAQLPRGEGLLDKSVPHLEIRQLMDGRLEFRYVDTRNEAKQWLRTVDGPDGFGRLESFFEQLRWFGGSA